MLGTIRANPGGTGPTVTARALGIVQTATYDAWAAYDPVAKGTRLGSQLRQPAAERTEANKTKAISYAAWRTLSWLFPSRKATYDAALSGAGLRRPTPPGARPGTTPTDIGMRAAEAVIAFRHAGRRQPARRRRRARTGRQAVHGLHRLPAGQHVELG